MVIRARFAAPVLLLSTTALACAGNPVEAAGQGEGGDTSLDSGTAGSTDPNSGASSDPDTSPSTDPTDDPGTASASASTEPGDSSGPLASSSGGGETTDGGSADACGNGIPEGDEACDDANADELDGCTSACAVGPTGFDIGPLQQTAALGGSGDTLYFEGDDDCPQGQVLVGLQGELTAENWLGTIRGVCRTIGLADTAPTSVVYGAGAELPMHGGYTDGGSYSLVCPEGEVVWRAQGQAGSIVTLACDGGERYLDTCYDDAWLQAQGHDIAPWVQRLQAACGSGWWTAG
jgi:cysteine-rich repeat protein